MPRVRVRTHVEQLQSFERGRTEVLRVAGWIYRQIATYVGYNVPVVCRYFPQWPVEHSRTRRPCSGRPRSRNTRHD